MYAALGATTTSATDRPSGLGTMLSTRSESGPTTRRTGAADESITRIARLSAAMSMTPLTPTGVGIRPHCCMLKPSRTVVVRPSTSTSWRRMAFRSLRMNRTRRPSGETSTNPPTAFPAGADCLLDSWRIAEIETVEIVAGGVAPHVEQRASVGRHGGRTVPRRAVGDLAPLDALPGATSNTRVSDSASPEMNAMRPVRRATSNSPR